MRKGSAVLEGYLTVAKLAKIKKRSPRRIRQLIELNIICAVNVNKNLKKPYYLIPAKEAKRYLDVTKYDK